MIVPTTFKPGEISEFLLRVFTDSDADVKELKKDEPGEKWYSCCASPPVLLTRVKVTGAAGLENNETFGVGSKCRWRLILDVLEKQVVLPPVNWLIS